MKACSSMSQSSQAGQKTWHGRSCNACNIKFIEGLACQFRFPGFGFEALGFSRGALDGCEGLRVHSLWFMFYGL